MKFLGLVLLFLSFQAHSSLVNKGVDIVYHIKNSNLSSTDKEYIKEKFNDINRILKNYIDEGSDTGLEKISTFYTCGISKDYSQYGILQINLDMDANKIGEAIIKQYPKSTGYFKCVEDLKENYLSKITSNHTHSCSCSGSKLTFKLRNNNTLVDDFIGVIDTYVNCRKANQCFF